MSTATITIRQTDTPSRSKMAGPCWIAIGETYAATRERSITATIGDVIEARGKAKLKRVSRTDEQLFTWRLIVTGDPADTVELHTAQYGQRVSAVVTGVRHA